MTLSSSPQFNSGSIPMATAFPESGGDDGQDRLSALPDDVLLEIVGGLGLRDVVRASVLSRRWRRVPRLLSRRLDIDVADFMPRDHGDSSSSDSYPAANDGHQIMSAYADATRWLLAPSAERAIESLSLSFFVAEPYLLHTVARAVDDLLDGAGGSLERLELDIWTDQVAPGAATLEQKRLFGRRFQSLFDAYPVPFRCLTSLTLQNLSFEEDVISGLFSSCTRMQLLSLSHCDFGATGNSTVRIDCPHAQLQVLEIRFCCFHRVEVIRALKLRRVHCDTWYGENPPLQFGDVPQLRKVTLVSNARYWQKRYALSECMSNTGILSTLDLDFRDGRIWVEPEESTELCYTFNNLRDLYLHNITARLELTWTLFILEAAPSLKNFYLTLSWHKCNRYKCKDSSWSNNVPWETPNFSHHSLQLLEIVGYAVDEQMEQYIQLVMQLAVCLKRIRLLEQEQCDKCDYQSIWPDWSMVPIWPVSSSPKYPSVQSERDETRSRLTEGFSSSLPVKIIIGTSHPVSRLFAYENDDDDVDDEGKEEE